MNRNEGCSRPAPRGAPPAAARTRHQEASTSELRHLQLLVLVIRRRAHHLPICDKVGAPLALEYIVAVRLALRRREDRPARNQPMCLGVRVRAEGVRESEVNVAVCACTPRDGGRHDIKDEQHRVHGAVELGPGQG